MSAYPKYFNTKKEATEYKKQMLGWNHIEIETVYGLDGNYHYRIRTERGVLREDGYVE